MNRQQIRLLGILKEAGFTPFQIRVCKEICSIPPGSAKSYKWVAGRIGDAGAARAVGQALNKNPFPILIPCHRVIKEDGSLGGFSQGSRLKKRLLELEKADIIR